MKKNIKTLLIGITIFLFLFLVGTENTYAKQTIMDNGMIDFSDDVYNPKHLNSLTGKDYYMCYYNGLETNVAYTINKSFSDQIKYKYSYSVAIVYFPAVSVLGLSYGPFWYDTTKDIPYYYRYRLYFQSPYEEVSNYMFKFSPSGDEDFHYVRYADSSNKTNFKKLFSEGECPEYVNFITTELTSWEDDNGYGRICFSKNSADCLGDKSAYQTYYSMHLGSQNSIYNNTGQKINAVFERWRGFAENVPSGTQKLKKKTVSWKPSEKSCKSDEKLNSLAENTRYIYEETSEAVLKILSNQAAQSGSSLEENSSSAISTMEGYFWYTKGDKKEAVKNIHEKYVKRMITATDAILDKWKTACEPYLTEAEEKEMDDHIIRKKAEIANYEYADYGEAPDVLTSCQDFAETDFYKQMMNIFSMAKIAIPIITLVLLAKDFISAAGSGKEDDMKKAQKHASLRLIIGLILFFIPTMVDILIMILDETVGTTVCGIK